MVRHSRSTLIPSTDHVGYYINFRRKQHSYGIRRHTIKRRSTAAVQQHLVWYALMCATRCAHSRWHTKRATRCHPHSKANHGSYTNGCDMYDYVELGVWKGPIRCFWLSLRWPSIIFFFTFFIHIYKLVTVDCIKYTIDLDLSYITHIQHSHTTHTKHMQRHHSITFDD